MDDKQWERFLVPYRNCRRVESEAQGDPHTI